MRLFGIKVKSLDAKSLCILTSYAEFVSCAVFARKQIFSSPAISGNLHAPQVITGPGLGPMLRFLSICKQPLLESVTPVKERLVWGMGSSLVCARPGVEFPALKKEDKKGGRDRLVFFLCGFYSGSVEHGRFTKTICYRILGLSCKLLGALKKVFGVHTVYGCFLHVDYFEELNMHISTHSWLLVIACLCTFFLKIAKTE